MYSKELHALVSDQPILSQALLEALVGTEYKRTRAKNDPVTLNGVARTKKWISLVAFMSLSDYVAEMLTAREHLVRACELRLWNSTKRDERRRRVGELLDYFDLADVADQRVNAMGPRERRLLHFGNRSR